MPRADVYPRFHELTRSQCLFRLRRSCALLVFALVPLTGPHAAVMLLTVGDDPGCGYRTSTSSNALQAAVDAVPLSVPPGDLYVIRVARSGSYVGTTVSISNLPC